ncbi:transcriptional regulator [Streptomyces gelaticus]|uniref:Transcriptional regulator n=1 Tax=Streptomyces gelaticus TaxID=285446 RepID=A0ABQ2VZW5_9ACTN|nr:transcriptional regulator [Streptomyces gelaticus]
MFRCDHVGSPVRFRTRTGIFPGLPFTGTLDRGRRVEWWDGETLISYSATADDVAKVRFSMSPLGETVYSFRTLASPSRRSQHQPWVDDILGRLKGVDLRPLRAVIPATGYVPDFLTPAPSGAPASVETELEVVRATEPAHFVDEVAWMLGDTGTPSAWRREAAPLHRRMLDEPEKAIEQITQLLRIYWKLALEPYWQRLYGGLVSDVRSRMRLMENSGAASVFSALNERIGWRDDRLTVRSTYNFEETLGGKGIVLVPSVFCGPDVLTMLPPLQSMIVYPRPGAADIWHHDGQDRRSSLAALLGGVRAAVLEALVMPSSTGELAAQVDVTPGAISQHVSVLRGCDLVTSHRSGQRVIHSLTETGEALVRGAVSTGARSL